jgi:prepilin-type N-terminal cleavage/methylation domain-containing protein
MLLGTGNVMTRKTFNSNDGFTLVESVLAAMILGIALGACVLSFSMAMKSVSTASNQMAALHYGRDRLEALRTNSFSDTALNAGTYNIPTNSTTYGNMYGNYTVSSVNSATKDITVRVIYPNRIRGGVSTNTLMTSMVSTLHE